LGFGLGVHAEGNGVLPELGLGLLLGLPSFLLPLLAHHQVRLVLLQLRRPVELSPARLTLVRLEVLVPVQVVLQVALRQEPGRALPTLEVLHLLVALLVHLQVPLLRELLPAKPALERFLSCVAVHVRLQSLLLTVRVPALLARKRLLPRVVHQMRLHVPLRQKSLYAALKAALERPLTCMGPHMSLQISCRVRTFAAIFEGAVVQFDLVALKLHFRY